MKLIPDYFKKTYIYTKAIFTGLIKAVDKTIENYLEKIAITNIEQNDQLTKKIQAMVQNTPALFYKIIKGIVLFPIINPKKAAFLALSNSNSIHHLVNAEPDGECTNGICTTTQLNSQIAPMSSSDIAATLLKSRFAIDKELETQPAAMKNCMKILEKITEIPFIIRSDHITETLTKHPETHIYCTTKTRVKNITGESSSGTFESTTKSVYLDSEIATEGTNVCGLVRHEFFHAENYFRHTTKHCKAKRKEEAVPVYPASPQRIKQYNDALDKGDQRTKDFLNLYNKKNHGNKLTESENKLLEKYLEASKACLPYAHYLPISNKMHVQLYKMHSQNKNQPIHIVDPTYGKFEVLDIRDNKPGIYAIVNTTEPFQTIMLISDKINYFLNLPLYKNKTEAIKLAEREVYTREFIPDETYQIFYPEAYELRQKDIKRCPDEEENQTYLNSPQPIY